VTMADRSQQRAIWPFF